jgi:flagellar hook protein FlgE
MMRSMFSAISGLRNHQTFMDVVGNNIANVNTTGFKGSRVTFQDILNQTLRSAAAPTATRGGVNGAQVGLGMLLAGIDTIQTQGNLQSTAKLTDLAIQGDGFFVLNDGVRNVYTRDGAFDIDINNNLVNPATGALVMGWQADATGAISTTGAVTSITIPSGSGTIGQPTTELTFTGNLDTATAAGGTVTATVPIYDSLGNRHDLTLTFTKSASPANTWTYAYTAAAGSGITLANASGTLTFDANGALQSNSQAGTMTVTFTNGANVVSIPTAGDFTGMTQLRATSDVKTATDGSAAGNLTSFSIAPNGVITGIYSNGQTRTIAQIALATFPNPGGLEKLGGNAYGPSAASGSPSIGAAETGGRGRISSGFLEMSNVDLAQQFTNMIMAQRGFQANSRVITASDEMLQDLVNLKR